MAPMSLMNYYDRIVWLNLATYILYFVIKYSLPIIYFLFFKCPCLKSCDNTESLPWVLLLTFGKQLGLKDGSKLHKIVLQDYTVMSRSLQVIVFYTVILGSVVLALGSALDITLFSPSYICSEDPSIDCYPQLINDTANLSMPVDISKPILDCSFWDSKGVSSQVTFICFQREFFNFELFLAITGGLLAFAFIALNASIGFLLRATQFFMKNGKSVPILVIRIIFIVITILVEIAMAILCIVLGATRVSVDTRDDDEGVTFLTSHATEILVVVGTIATLLWLPWEKYVESQPSGLRSALADHVEPPPGNGEFELECRQVET